MAGPTGLATQVAIAEESTYGTPASLASARGIEITDDGVEDTFERITSEGLRAGRSYQQWWKPNRKGAEGDIELELANQGQGILWKHALGSIATTAAGTLGKKHAAATGPILGKSLTVQIGRPDVTGTVRPFTYHGGKVDEWELACEVDELAKLTLSMDFEESDTSTALATATYPTNLELFDFIGATVTVGGTAEDVSELTISTSNNLKTDRYFLRGSSLKKEPLEETEARETEIELTEEFSGTAAFARMANGTEAAVVATFMGSQYEAGQNFKVVLTASRCRFDEGTPTAGGADVVEQPSTAFVLAPTDGSAAVKVDYYTTDATP